MKAKKEAGVHMRQVLTTGREVKQNTPKQIDVWLTNKTYEPIASNTQKEVKEWVNYSTPKMPPLPEKITVIKPEPIKIVKQDKKLWKAYHKLVWKITDKQPIKRLKNFDKRGFKSYHLDHKVSIWYGFKNRIDPKIIGGIDNLEFIPYKDNMAKATKCNFYGAKNMQTVLFI